MTALLVIATFLLDTLGAALKLPDWVLELSLYKHLGQPMAGVVRPGRARRRGRPRVGGLARRRVRACSGATSAGNVRG